MIPGSNLLGRALKVIAKQTLSYYKFAGRTLNDVGQDITAYDAPVDIKGSFQAVNQSLYEMNGLDLQKSYFIFYVEQGLMDIERDTSGDQLEFFGRRYQVQSNAEWIDIDGWIGLLCVEVKNPNA